MIFHKPALPAALSLAAGLLVLMGACSPDAVVKNVGWWLSAVRDLARIHWARMPRYASAEWKLFRAEMAALWVRQNNVWEKGKPPAEGGEGYVAHGSEVLFLDEIGAPPGGGDGRSSF